MENVEARREQNAASVEISVDRKGLTNFAIARFNSLIDMHILEFQRVPDCAGAAERGRYSCRRASGELKIKTNTRWLPLPEKCVEMKAACESKFV